MANHPMQPVVTDEHGVKRFKENKIVRFLLDAGRIDLNAIARMPFDREDREHFAQLIGYSLAGFMELDYVSDEACDAAIEASESSKIEVEAEFLKEVLREIESRWHLMDENRGPYGGDLEQAIAEGSVPVIKELRRIIAEASCSEEPADPYKI